MAWAQSDSARFERRDGQKRRFQAPRGRWHRGFNGFGRGGDLCFAFRCALERGGIARGVRGGATSTRKRARAFQIHQNCATR